MTGVVIDTHVLIWYIFEPNRLSETALTTIEKVNITNSQIYIPSISLIEITYLVEKGRIPQEVLTRVNQAIDSPNVNLFLVPLDRRITLSFEEIDKSIVPEMPDRIIAATALSLELPLITRDLKIQNLSNIQIIW
ncbi:type II toxin-antitoxin system VapC family toxin [Cyanobacterium aponinum]|uniref:PIN domain-containing protein n=1 Tax=Cyanobacterium aponinum 0216 TaxID=2676140 RepID=A0A844GVU8_9CHRO|nr:type II toxin-antitoxin system VapC family toxin [Cyanobacterium aponinum]MTF39008.1 PIN domain-containing protein [Cyanobacterium aponinum 0216]